MTETIYARVKRILTAKVEDGVEAMERNGGASIMREAVREIDRAIDDVRTSHVAATSQRLQAVRQQDMAKEHLAKLTEKAKFALEAGRDDLAEAAIVRQIDFERQLPALMVSEQDAITKEAELDEFILALTSRKTEMEETLKAYELAHRQLLVTSQNGLEPKAGIERAVGRAEAAFDRAIKGTGNVSFTKSSAGVINKVAEIDAMQHQSEVAQRLAMLKAG